MLEWSYCGIDANLMALHTYQQNRNESELEFQGCRKIYTCMLNSVCSDGYSFIKRGTANANTYPDSKVPGANMGPTWVLSAPDGPHVGPMNLAIRVPIKRLFHWRWSDMLALLMLSILYVIVVYIPMSGSMPWNIITWQPREAIPKCLEPWRQVQSILIC